MWEVDYLPIKHVNNHAKSWYGSTNRYISMTKRLDEIYVDRTIKYFNRFAPPPWESMKESASGSLILLLETRIRSILLNIFGVNRTWFFHSSATWTVLLFGLNLWAHQENISLNSKNLGIQPIFTYIFIQTLLFFLYSRVNLLSHWYAMNQWKSLS